jgi:NadR type nicotinamide-nucleotide adenylyltransferase
MEKDFQQQPANGLKRIVFYGPESSGKTSLARDLAKIYSTEWVPEFARDYLQKKYDKTGEICAPEDLLPIARGQVKLENECSNKAKKYLFCDTNVLQTYYYGKAYYRNFANPLLKNIACHHHYDYYFLTDIDVPWIPDDLRDKPNDRMEMFDFFKKSLFDNQINYTKLSGNHRERIEKVKQIIEQN